MIYPLPVSQTSWVKKRLADLFHTGRGCGRGGVLIHWVFFLTNIEDAVCGTQLDHAFDSPCLSCNGHVGLANIAGTFGWKLQQESRVAMGRNTKHGVESLTHIGNPGGSTFVTLTRNSARFVNILVVAALRDSTGSGARRQ